MKRTRRHGSPAYRQLWRVVEGAVADALEHHPDYLTARGARHARRSVTKRVVGAVMGYAEQSAQGRSRYSRAADTAGSVRSRPGQDPPPGAESDRGE